MSAAKTALLPLAGIALLGAQGVYVQRVTPRLPGAAGPDTGIVPGTAPMLRLAVIGESTADGVGAASHADALTGQLAESLAARFGCGVAWQAVGKTGANARTVLEELAPRVRPADLVVVALGVNDTIELHSANRYRRDLLRLVCALRDRLGPVPVLLAGVPPMGRFPALPPPLRQVLGLRSAALAKAAASLAALPDVTYAPMPVDLLDADTFATDGFHPAPAGYQVWAGQLAALVSR
jgi:lysophospholipase L1-like esterase